MSRQFFAQSSAQRQRRVRAANRAKLLAAATSSTDEQSSSDETVRPNLGALLDNDSFMFSTFDAPGGTKMDEQNNEPSLSTSSEDNDDEIDELLLRTDSNCKRKLYEGSSLSVYDASKTIMKLIRRLNLDKAKTNILLHEIRSLLPDTNKLPRTLRGLMKILREYSLMIQIISSCVV